MLLLFLTLNRLINPGKGKKTRQVRSKHTGGKLYVEWEGLIYTDKGETQEVQVQHMRAEEVLSADERQEHR